jgi:hypothetical protein
MGAALRHAWQSRPRFLEAVLGGLVWALLVPASLIAGASWHGGALHPDWVRLAAMSALAAAIAFPLSLWLLRMVPHKAGSRGFALAFLALAASTLGLTALHFALDFWLYFSQWHAAPFSRIWLLQFAFTNASAVYQFMVSGLRMHVPFGIALLFPASLWLARRTSR